MHEKAIPWKTCEIVITSRSNQYLRLSDHECDDLASFESAQMQRAKIFVYEPCVNAFSKCRVRKYKCFD
jgi:hypothetical protein